MGSGNSTILGSLIRLCSSTRATFGRHLARSGSSTLGTGGDNQQIARHKTVCGDTIDADDARIAPALEGIGLDALAAGHLLDSHALVG